MCACVYTSCWRLGVPVCVPPVVLRPSGVESDEKLLFEPKADPYMERWSCFLSYPLSCFPPEVLQGRKRRGHPSKSTYLHICSDVGIFSQCWQARQWSARADESGHLGRGLSRGCGSLPHPYRSISYRWSVIHLTALHSSLDISRFYLKWKLRMNLHM